MSFAINILCRYVSSICLTLLVPAPLPAVADYFVVLGPVAAGGGLDYASGAPFGRLAAQKFHMCGEAISAFRMNRPDGYRDSRKCDAHTQT